MRKPLISLVLVAVASSALATNFAILLGGSGSSENLIDCSGGNWIRQLADDGTVSSGLAAKKHIGNVKFEEISFRFAVGSNEPLCQWINEAMLGQAKPRDAVVLKQALPGGAIVSAAVSSMTISSVSLPGVGEWDDRPGEILIEARPGGIETKTIPTARLPRQKQKMWVPANFRMMIGQPGGPPVTVPVLAMTKTVLYSDNGKGGENPLYEGKTSQLRIAAGDAGYWMNWWRGIDGGDLAPRPVLLSYFERGDRPTETQFRCDFHLVGLSDGTGLGRPVETLLPYEPVAVTIQPTRSINDGKRGILSIIR